MRVEIRKFSSSDLDSLVRYANNKNIALNLTDQFPHPYSRDHGEKFLATVKTHIPVRVFAIECDGQFCGAIGLHPQDDIMRLNCELGYWIAEPFWGKGVATKAIELIVKYGFENFDIQRIFARPFGRNLASRRVLEKAGFKLEAKLEKTIIKNGVIEDEYIFAIRK